MTQQEKGNPTFGWVNGGLYFNPEKSNFQLCDQMADRYSTNAWWRFMLQIFSQRMFNFKPDNHSSSCRALHNTLVAFCHLQTED